MRSRSSATIAAYRVARLAFVASGLAAGADSAALAALPSARPASFRADVSLLVVNHRPGHPAEAAPDPQGDLRARQVAAIESYLRHAYTIYLGLKACAELRTEQNDPSFLSTVGLDEARKALHAIDGAASSVGVDVGAQWAQAAPKAVVTAEALKREPHKVVAVCQRMGGIFRNDEANLQNLLAAVGSKQVLIPKDF
ncbi:exported protein of unknown function [Beijerinckiaceae bacterium RH AL1]|nr:exported protein of unknown function [Beijerinckiaceae bacterium RH AL8]VVB42657.1 exported protein of unknown function [Beijerinckiaceae bacterium RH CH11]VVC53428.1 exported protein of unknown function [Beijerinckiaceae bacterium RH AL1]